VQEITRTLERALKEHEQFNGGESGLEQKIEAMTAKLSEERAQLAQIKELLEQSGAKLNAGLDRIKYLHKVGDEKTAAANQLSLEVEKVSSDLAHLVQNLEEKYGPGCLEKPSPTPVQEEMVEPVITAEMSAEEEVLLGEEVERLRERIRRLGEVNVMAIEEYEELKKRFDYLLTERSDLDHSIKNLQDAIEHINKTSEERFKKAFEAIADRFERLFPIIFGGGQAQLSLVYPEGSNDILDAGVDILAQPPGKKIVNIGLLSGGEKALTAVSLIFAIFMVKPSPFCVLDEVDAPLDDANIGKFNALLREMSAKSQFILITHNKKTMELNDTLYGVTMEEPGVSKMVSIEMH
jgi:chromosome segregation protein